MEFQEYPKWVSAPSGQRVIVPDAETEAAVVAGEDVIPKFAVGASSTEQPIVPSVKAAKEAAKKAAPTRGRAKKE